MRGLLRASQELSSSAPAQPWLLLGIWIGRDAAANSAQLQLLSSLLHEQPGARLMGIAVGSEAVSRGDVSAATLVQLVAQVRMQSAEYNTAHTQGDCQSAPVTTAQGIVACIPCATMPLAAPQVRDVLRAAAATTASGGALRAVPVLTVEPPEAFTDQLLAAVDVAGIVLQPFFGAQLDTSHDGCEAAGHVSITPDHSPAPVGVCSALALAQHADGTPAATLCQVRRMFILSRHIQVGAACMRG